MTAPKAAAIVAVIVVLAGAGFGAYWLGMNAGMNMAAAPSPADGRKVLYWHDPMVPGQKFDKPGKSPFMDMQLVPVYADDASEEGGVTISPRVQQNLGMRTAEARLASLEAKVELVGSVAYNERDSAVVQARANGFLERLHVRAPLDPVQKGAPLAEMLVPDWVAAQEEFLAVARMSQAGIAGLREGAIQRMRLAGMTEDHIRVVESTGTVQPRATLRAPLTGVVSELTAREGMTVAVGAPLFRLNGLSTVWVNAEVPESFAGSVRPGNAIQARAAAFPGEVFSGKVGAILPEINPATRTIKARVELANPHGRLVPGMFVTVDLVPQVRGQVLQVPTEAVIQTGTRTIVMVAETAGDGKPRFKPVEVEIGREAEGMTEVRKGLQPGAKVVVSGQFLIDSEASLKASTQRLGGTAGQETVVHRGEGTLEKIDRETVTLSHGPIPSLKWGSMTMDFRKPPEEIPPGVAPGTKVTFEFVQAPDGEFALKSISKATSK